MTDEPDQQPNLGILLLIPYRFMEQAVLDELKAHGHDLPLNQARVLAASATALAPGPPGPSSSSEQANDRHDRLHLQNAGYVERCPDPLDDVRDSW